MRVTVNKFLNVRAGEPSVNAPCYQYLAPGSELDVDDQLYSGDIYKGIGDWLRDGANNYYWSGGINYRIGLDGKLQHLVDISSVAYNYNSLLKISTKYKNTKGNNTFVAIIDTGCYRHSAVVGSIEKSYDVFSKKEIQSDESSNAHGTFLAGLIAANESPGSKIVGIAPKAKLIIVKAIKDDQVFAQPVLDALNWIDGLSSPPDVINMSFDFNPGLLLNNFKKVFDSLSKKDVAIVAAAQDGSQLYSHSIFYPASDSNVIGIGGILKNEIDSSPLNTQVDFILPNLSFTSLNNFPNDYRTLSGSSMATAIVTGCFALVKSYNPTLRPMSIVQILKSESFLLSNFDNNLKLYKK